MFFLYLYWHLWYGRWLCFQHNALQLEDNNFLFRYWFWSSILFKSATFRTLAEARFGAEQENPGERMFSILFSKELWTSVNVLAHKPINKFIRGIFRVNLKLSRLKKIMQNVCDARLLRWSIWGNLVECSGEKLAWQHFLALYFETMKSWKIHQRGYRKKNITCEIRCLLLHLNVPSVVLYWLPDAQMVYICDYWLIFNEHQLE